MAEYSTTVSAAIEKWRGIVENRLDELTRKPEGFPYPDIYEMVRYSLLNAGKRLRPILTLEFCRVCGKDALAALDCACAVEMIHTYSLIHDDLPCMDDDDLRRGKPSCHVKFGEAQALLAGDALQSIAAKTIAECKTASAEQLLCAGAQLACLSGPDGMIGGQMLDLDSEGKHVGEDTLLSLVSGKTCALIEAACVMGCIIAGADDNIVAAARKFAYEFGLAFQIIDDILDVTSSAEVLGKPVCSDEENDKSTYVSLLGIDGARNLAQIHSEKAIDALAVIDGDTEFFKALVMWQLERIY